MAKSSADDLELRRACETAMEGSNQKVELCGNVLSDEMNICVSNTGGLDNGWEFPITGVHEATCNLGYAKGSISTPGGTWCTGCERTG